jgi:ethanolamine ammonia-lyase large subunit
MYNKITIEDINKFNLNEDELQQIVNDITMKYAHDFNTKITHDLLKEDIQQTINSYTIQKRRDSKINQILGDEPTIHNNRINLTIDIQMLD